MKRHQTVITKYGQAIYKVRGDRGVKYNVGENLFIIYTCIEIEGEGKKW